MLLHFCGRALAKRRKACCFKFEVGSEGEREEHIKHLRRDELSGRDVHSLRDGGGKGFAHFSSQIGVFGSIYLKVLMSSSSLKNCHHCEASLL